MQPRAQNADELWCGACRAMHAKSAFGKDRNTPQGLAYACKTAVKIRNRTAHSKTRLANNLRHGQLRLARKASPERITWALKKMLSDAARRAKSGGIEFSLSISDLLPPPICPVFGMALVYQANGKRLPSSASLDRMDSRAGYTPSNVWIISWRANQIKSDATAAELRVVADAIDARIGKKLAGRTLDGRLHDEYPA